MEISRFPCKRLLRMPGSTTTRGQHVSCDIDTSRVAFCGTENIGTPNLSYAAQYLACALPCERFTSALAGNPCITRGRCGSLHLHRDGLPPPTSCRSPGGPVQYIRRGRMQRSKPSVRPPRDSSSSISCRHGLRNGRDGDANRAAALHYRPLPSASLTAQPRLLRQARHSTHSGIWVLSKATSNKATGADIAAAIGVAGGKVTGIAVAGAEGGGSS
jgi:hypothetical protein